MTVQARMLARKHAPRTSQAIRGGCAHSSHNTGLRQLSAQALHAHRRELRVFFPLRAEVGVLSPASSTPRVGARSGSGSVPRISSCSIIVVASPSAWSREAEADERPRGGSLGGPAIYEVIGWGFAGPDLCEV